MRRVPTDGADQSVTFSAFVLTRDIHCYGNSARVYVRPSVRHVLAVRRTRCKLSSKFFSVM